MGLLDEIRDVQSQASVGGKCTVGLILTGLDAADRDGLEAAFEDTAAIRSRAIHDVLRNRGYEVGYTSVVRHRAGRCLCDR